MEQAADLRMTRIVFGILAFALTLNFAGEHGLALLVAGATLLAGSRLLLRREAGHLSVFSGYAAEGAGVSLAVAGLCGLVVAIF